MLTEKEDDASFKTGVGVKHTPGDASPSLISLLKKVRNVNNLDNDKMLSEAVAQESIGEIGFYYADKKRAKNIFKQSKVQYLSRLDSLNSNAIIHTIDEKVNRKIDTVTLDKGIDFNAELLNGYEGGKYNISVTVYYLDNLNKYVDNPNNVLLYDKSKVNHEEASGSLVPSLSNDSPYYNDIIEQNNSDVKLQKSISREPSISEEASDYILDTNEYQEILDIVDQRFEATGRKELSPKAIDRLAGKLLTKSKSNYSRERLTERLTALFDYIANSRDLEWSEVTTIAAEISKDVLKESQTLDRSMLK